MNGNNITEEKALEERAKYIGAFNSTMIDIWKEKIVDMEVMDTKSLLNSVAALPVRADGRFSEVVLMQTFLEYGLWQDYGVGREVPRGNPGDIGRVKVRERRRWFSLKYYSSVMNLRDFMADSMGREFIGIMSDAFNDKRLKGSTEFYKKRNM